MFLWGIRMATLGIPNLCGANPNQENLLNKINELADNVISNLNADASATAAAVQEKLDEGLAELKKLVPEIPSLPSTNLQAELTSLLALSPTSLTYAASLAKITTDFDDALAKKGLSLDTLLKDGLAKIAGGGDLCGIVPNLEIESGSTEVKETAGTAGQADTAPEAEVASVVATALAVTSAANVALATRKDEVASLAKTSLGEIGKLIGTIDRAHGTVSPEIRTKLREMDAEVTLQKAIKNIVSPAETRQTNYTDVVSNLEPKAVTGADNTGTNVAPTQDINADDPNVDLKKKVLLNIEKAYAKWNAESGRESMSKVWKSANKGYPHNIVPGSNKTKMYQKPTKKYDTKDKTGGFRYENVTDLTMDFTFQGRTYPNITFHLAFRTSIDMIKIVNDERRMFKRHLESGGNPTEIIPAVASYTDHTVPDATEGFKALAKFMKDNMTVPVKVPEEEVAKEVIPKPPVKKQLDRASARRLYLYNRNKKRKEIIAEYEEQYSDVGLKVRSFTTRGAGAHIAVVRLGKDWGGAIGSANKSTLDKAIEAAVADAKRNYNQTASGA